MTWRRPLTAMTEWLIIERTDVGNMARCSICTKFGKSGGGKKAELWISSPVCLGRHRRQKLTTHHNSDRHREATELQRATKDVPTIEQATSAMTTKAKEMTAKNMTVVYNGILRGHSYADHSHQHLLLDTLGCNVGNQHHTGRAAAQTVDVIYDTFRDEVSRHLKTPNPATGRPRHIHLSMDKFTEGGNQRQAVNLRTLDSDGSPVVVHGTTGVIRNYDDPVPRYTATQTRKGTTRDRHEADGRGVACHVADCLTKDLKLTESDIKIQVTCSSSDCEAVYSGARNGFRRIWREMFNPGHVHLDDRDHRLETLLAKVRREGTWMDGYLERLHQVIGLFQGSGLLKRQIRRAAAQLDEVSLSLQRLVETRFVEYLVVAVTKVLHNRAAMVTVLQDMLAQQTLFSGVAHRSLRTRLPVATS